MELLNKVKDVLKESGSSSNTEISDLIEAAKIDLTLAGINESKIVDTDMLIVRAINLYCKAHFAYEDTKLADRFSDEYNKLKIQLSISSTYREGNRI